MYKLISLIEDRIQWRRLLPAGRLSADQGTAHLPFS